MEIETYALSIERVFSPSVAHQEFLGGWVPPNPEARALQTAAAGTRYTSLIARLVTAEFPGSDHAGAVITAAID
jgi:hypothetical protein